MIGARYWSTGISVTHCAGLTGGPAAKPEPREWAAKAEFFDDGFCETDSTQGELHTRYAVETLSKSIDLIKADVERMGIEWKNPTIYMRGDGEDEEFPPPEGWRQLLAAECERIGWQETYVVVWVLFALTVVSTAYSFGRSVRTDTPGRVAVAGVTCDFDCTTPETDLIEEQCDLPGVAAVRLTLYRANGYRITREIACVGRD